MPEEKSAPFIRARNRGQVTTVLERWQHAYKAANPNRVSRYVYSPEHKPELSQVLAKEAVGYRLVKYKDLGVSFEGMDPEAVVRVADLVLMSNDEATVRALIKDNERNAHNQLTSVQAGYQNEIQTAADALRKKEHTRPGMAPVGSAVIATKDFEYDVQQRSGEE